MFWSDVQGHNKLRNAATAYNLKKIPEPHKQNPNTHGRDSESSQKGFKIRFFSCNTKLRSKVPGPSVFSKEKTSPASGGEPR